jgi:hypothetical protein
MHECREKEPDDQGMNGMETRIMGISNELYKLSSAVTLASLNFMHGILELVNIEARSRNLTHRSVLTGQVSGYFLLLREILYLP